MLYLQVHLKTPSRDTSGHQRYGPDELVRIAVILRNVHELFVKGKLHPTSAVVAELAQSMENLYRDINIVIANEFAAICDNLGADARPEIPVLDR